MINVLYFFSSEKGYVALNVLLNTVINVIFKELIQLKIIHKLYFNLVNIEKFSFFLNNCENLKNSSKLLHILTSKILLCEFSALK